MHIYSDMPNSKYNIQIRFFVFLLFRYLWSNVVAGIKYIGMPHGRWSFQRRRRQAAARHVVVLNFKYTQYACNGSFHKFMWKFAYFELERISWKVRTRILVTACDLVTVCVCDVFARQFDCWQCWSHLIDARVRICKIILLWCAYCPYCYAGV